MNYKKSNFNFVYRRNFNEFVIYNTFSKALVVLDNEEISQYENGSYIDKIMQKQLIDNGILIENSFDEMRFLKYLHYRTKFANDTLFLTIAPTLECNFACPYCYENRRNGKMSEEIQDAIIAFIEGVIKKGVSNIDITWYGGEPLLYTDIVLSMSKKITDLIMKYNCKMSMYMVTNGYLLNKRIVELMDTVGITRIQVTLDGLRDNHNKRRPLRNGDGTFDRILDNLNLFCDSPIEVLVRMNVDNTNCYDYIKLKECIESLGNPNIELYPSPVEDLNKDTINEISNFMSREQFESFTMKICEEGYLDSKSFSVMDDRYCFCTAETENCYVVDDRGDFYKCWDEVGRIEYRCFNILDPENINYNAISQYLIDDPFSNEQCSDCIFLPLCFGGCKFQKAHMDKSVCGFTEEVLKKYIETAFFNKAQ